MTEPHTLMQACKITAEQFERPWGSAQLIYRALQMVPDDKFRLPRSSGRAFVKARYRHAAIFTLGLTLFEDIASVGTRVSEIGGLLMRPYSLMPELRVDDPWRPVQLLGGPLYPIEVGWTLVDEIERAIRLGHESTNEYLLTLTVHSSSIPRMGHAIRIAGDASKILWFGEAVGTPEETASTPIGPMEKNRGPVQSMLTIDGALFSFLGKHIHWSEGARLRTH